MKFKQRNSQSGVTLIVAVLVLSVVSVLSFSLGALVLREIKISRELSKSEPAIIAAEAGAETALFYRIRNLQGVGPAEMFEGCVAGDPGTQGSIGSSLYEFCHMYYDNPYIFGTHGNNIEVVVLYNPEEPGTSAAGYESISITATSSNAAVLLRADAYDLADPAAIAATLIIGVPSTGTMGGLDPDTSYAIFLYPCNTPPPPATNPTCSADARVSGTVVTVSGPTAGIPAKFPRIVSKGVRDNLIRQLELKLYGGP